MIQQVNLYQDIIRQEQAKTAFNPYAAALMLATIVFTVVSLYLFWNLTNLKTQVAQSRKALSAEEAKVAALLSKVPKKSMDTSIIAQIVQQQNKVNELTQTIQFLSQNVFNNNHGFSSYLQALSNQSVPEVWLTRIFINEPEQKITLEGSTFQSDQIPFFLYQLQKERVFQGHSFAQLTMLKSEKNSEQIDFKLNSKIDPKDGNEHN